MRRGRLPLIVIDCTVGLGAGVLSRSWEPELGRRDGCSRNLALGVVPDRAGKEFRHFVSSGEFSRSLPGASVI